MNVFVLCTGRCGSLTFVAASRQIKNYSAAHESRSGVVGPGRVAYPPNHIEADNRLSWFLGRLDVAYGNDAFYVHLKRNELDTARSFLRRYEGGIIRAYRSGILLGGDSEVDPLQVCLDYIATVNLNIDAFLKNKTRKLTVSLETAKTDFAVFWNLIGAVGDLELACAEWEKFHNASGASGAEPPAPPSAAAQLVRGARKKLLG